MIRSVLLNHRAVAKGIREENQMATARLVTPPREDEDPFENGRISRSELLQQLNRIVSSKHFKNSKRYPSFLRFVVERTLEGKTDDLKERTLGTDVFARQSDYDTNADPIVRITAGEVRKRIAQYYQEPGHEHELRIDLPLGSYVPHFLPAARSPQNAEHDIQIEKAGASIGPSTLPHEHALVGTEAMRPSAATEAGRNLRWKQILFFGLLSLIAALSTGVFFLQNRSRDKGIAYFWRPVMASSGQALIVIGVHSLDSGGQDMPVDTHAISAQDAQENMLTAMVRSDMVPISDIVSYSRVIDLLTRRNRAYRTKGSSDTTLEDLRQGPVILIGGLDNVWTMRLVSTLRYNFFTLTPSESEIRDSKDPSRAWKFDNMQLAKGNTRDYAIVASYFDPTIEQHVMIVAGIGKAGTEAAAEFLTSDSHLETWLAKSKVARGKNIEFVLSTETLDGQPGPPHVLASAIW